MIIYGSLNGLSTIRNFWREAICGKEGATRIVLNDSLLLLLIKNQAISSTSVTIGYFLFSIATEFLLITPNYKFRKNHDDELGFQMDVSIGSAFQTSNESSRRKKRRLATDDYSFATVEIFNIC